MSRGVPIAPGPASSKRNAGEVGGAPPVQRKLIIVQFGGGTRSSETIDDPEHRHIPHLWKEMIPRGTLFTNMRVEGKVVHPNSTGSIMTGHWEYEDIDWGKHVAHPTIFEIYRKTRGAPDTAAWAFVYASILARTGESRAAGYGPEFAANVVEPPTIPRTTAETMDQLLRQAGARGSIEAERKAIDESAGLARATSRIARGGLRSDAARAFLDREYEAWRSADGTTSHDAFLTDRATACMKKFAPDVMAIAYGEIDCAHYGSWSRYVEAIRRTDELAWRLWRATAEIAAYSDQTLLLILPDHGRELERPGGTGFIHHSDFYTNEGADEGCRRVWMLALGLGVAAGRRIEESVPITAVAATGLEFLGLEASPGSAPPVLSLTSNGLRSECP
jgi:hypothetical protein